MKKISCIAVVLLLFLFISAAYAENGTCGANVSWNLSDSGVLTLSGSGPMDDYSYSTNIPWHNHTDSIKSVIVEEGVTTISDKVFMGCDNLTEINVASENPSYASQNGILFSKDLATLIYYPAGKSDPSYTVPDTVTKISDYAFFGNKHITDLSISDGVKYIGSLAFRNMKKLINITFPETLLSIDDGAFSLCDNLTSIKFPASLMSLGDCMFEGSSKLSKIEVAEGSKYFVAEDGVLFSADKTKLVAYPPAKQDSTYVIPAGVQVIGKFAFMYCDNLISVIFPDSLISFENYAFSLCRSLISLDIPEGTLSIGDYAFDSCDSLSTVILPASLNAIGDSAFAFDINLTSVTIKGLETSFDKNGVFDYCGYNFTIYAPKGSTAESLAKKEGINFSVISTESLSTGSSSSESASNSYEATIAALQTQIVESLYTATPTPASTADAYAATISALQTQIVESLYTPTPTLTPTPENIYEATITALQTQMADADTSQNTEGQEASESTVLDFITTGATINFGTYEQDNDPTNGNEPIAWIVLTADDDKCLLLSKYLLEPMAYNNSDNYDEDITWQDSSLRNWLNNDFLSTAFNRTDQSLIISSQLSNSDNPKFESDGGADTTDKIFLLSQNDILLYLSDGEELKCPMTDTAQQKLSDLYLNSDLGDYESNLAMLKRLSEEGGGKLFWWWWLRTPGQTNSWASVVDIDGSVDLWGGVINSYFGAVRPALWLDLNALRSYYENDDSENEAGKPEKNGFADGQNYLVHIGAFTIEIPNYWAASKNDGSKYTAYAAEIGKNVAVLNMWASYDDDDSVTFEILKRDTVNGNMAAIISNGFDETGPVTYEPIEITGIKGYIYNTTFVRSGLSGKLTMVCLPSVSDNQWIYISLSETDMAEYSYTKDFQKIIHSIEETAKAQAEFIKTLSFDPSTLKVGDMVSFGQYKQVDYLDQHPIKWQVLEVKSDRALLISKYALEANSFGNSSWKRSGMRDWLNTDFYNSAFNSNEQQLILKVTNSNPDNPSYPTEDSAPTEDKIFLLSIEEAEKYFKDPASRQCSPTGQTRRKISSTSDSYWNHNSIGSNGKVWWWLRTPGYQSGMVAGVDEYGYIYYYGRSSSDDGSGVRPAFWLKLNQNGTES